MSYNISNLWMALQSNELLIGHPNLKNLRARVAKDLSDMDTELAPEEPKPVPNNPIVAVKPVSVELPDPPAPTEPFDRRA